MSPPHHLVPLLAIAALPLAASAQASPQPLVRIRNDELQRAASGWPALAATAVAPAIDAARAAWARNLGEAPALAADAYDPKAILVPGGGRAPARSAEDRAAILRDWSARWGAVRQAATLFRAALGDADVLEITQLSTASDARPVLLTWWRARQGGWRKLAEAAAERAPGAQAGGAADVAALEALGARWQELVDRKDPAALAAGTYDADARYLRLWDGSQRLFEGRSGIAEEYGAYIPVPTYRLAVAPFAVVVASGTSGFVVGRFEASNVNLSMRGLYAWVVTRRSPEAPWSIAFETDHAERLPAAGP